MVPLRVSATPVPDESLPGFIVRLAERARFRNAVRLASMVGLRQPGSAATPAGLNGLAGLAGVDAALLQGMSYRPTGRLAHCRFGAGELHREFLDISGRRFCPACLVDHPRHRAAWDFALLTACPKHKARLVARCPACNRKADWRHPTVASCPCGAMLTKCKMLLVNMEEAQANANVLDLAAGLDTPWLPAGLQACARSDLTRVLMCLGMFLTGWRGQRRIEALVASGPDRTAAVLVAGMRCLEDWPTSLHGYLDQARRREDSRPGRYGARRALGPFYSWMNALEHTAARDALVDATRAYVGKDEKLASRVHRSVLVSPEGGRAATGLIGMNEAAATLGRSGQGVRRLMAEGLLPAVETDGRGVPAARARAAVAVLADGARGWLSMRELAVALGVSRARTARIVGAGLLRPVHGGPSNGWAIWSFDPGEVTSFLERLSRDPHSGCADVGFNHTVEALRRQGLEIEDVLKRILDGSLSVRAVRGDAVGLKRLTFSRADVRSACRALEGGRSDVMTVQAVAERLGLKWEVIAHLIRIGLLAQVSKGVEVSAVDSFERNYVLGRDLASKMGTSPRQIVKYMAYLGIQAVTGPKVDGSRQNVFSKEDMEKFTFIYGL